MVIYTADPAVNYAGEAVVAAGADSDVLSYRRFRTPAPCIGVIVAPLVGGNRTSFLPATIDSTVAIATNIDQHSFGALLALGWDVIVVMVAVARGSAQNLPDANTFLRYVGALGKTNVAQASITSSALTGGGSYAITTIIAGVNGVSDEFQRITKTGTVSGGTYKITFGGQETTALNWNATHAQIKAALEALSTILVGNISVHDAANQTGNEVNSVNLSVDSWTENSLYGPAYDGNGMTLVKGPTLTGLTEADDVTPETTHPAEDPLRLDSFKAMTMFVQHFRRFLESQYEGVPIVGWGGSWAATSLSWVAYNDDLSDYYFPASTDGQQDFEPTDDLFDALVLYVPQSSMGQFADSTYLSGIPRKTSNGGSPHYDDQATNCGDGLRTLLPYMSACVFGTAAAVFARNRGIPVHLASASWDDTIVGDYSSANVSTTIVNPHHGWMAAAFAKAFGPQVRFLSVEDVSAVAPLNAAAMITAGIHPTEILTGEADLLVDRLAWLSDVVDVFNGAAADPNDADVRSLDFSDLAAAQAATPVIFDEGPLLTVKVRNDTDVMLAGSFDGVNDHFVVAAGETWDIDRTPDNVLQGPAGDYRGPHKLHPQRVPIRSGTLALRGATANPASGTIRINVARQRVS